MQPTRASRGKSAAAKPAAGQLQSPLQRRGGPGSTTTVPKPKPDPTSNLRLRTQKAVAVSVAASEEAPQYTAAADLQEESSRQSFEVDAPLEPIPEQSERSLRSASSTSTDMPAASSAAALELPPLPVRTAVKAEGSKLPSCQSGISVARSISAAPLEAPGQPAQSSKAFSSAEQPTQAEPQTIEEAWELSARASAAPAGAEPEATAAQLVDVPELPTSEPNAAHAPAGKSKASRRSDTLSDLSMSEPRSSLPRSSRHSAADSSFSAGAPCGLYSDEDEDEVAERAAEEQSEDADGAAKAQHEAALAAFLAGEHATSNPMAAPLSAAVATAKAHMPLRTALQVSSVAPATLAGLQRIASACSADAGEAFDAQAALYSDEEGDADDSCAPEAVRASATEPADDGAASQARGAAPDHALSSVLAAATDKEPGRATLEVGSPAGQGAEVVRSELGPRPTRSTLGALRTAWSIAASCVLWAKQMDTSQTSSR
jgi:hypothetical protein